MLKKNGVLWSTIALFFAGADSFAEYGRSNCRQDISNLLPGQCICDIYDKAGNGSIDGFTLVSCSNLACEEFEIEEAPKQCEKPHRGVTCFLNNSEVDHCALLLPRVEVALPAKEVCSNAASDLNSRGYKSAYFSYLSDISCVSWGRDYPLPYGWRFTGEFAEGWN